MAQFSSYQECNDLFLPLFPASSDLFSGKGISIQKFLRLNHT